MEECLRQHIKEQKQIVDEEFEENAQEIKETFDNEIKQNAIHPVTFEEMESKYK